MSTVYNKVVIDGVIKIDLSQDTVTEAGHILTGHTGHLANGNQVPGTGSGSGSITITEEANTTGTTCVISIGSSSVPSETWETLFNGSALAVSQEVSPGAYFWITELADVYPTIGSTWRITIDNVEYRCIAREAVVNDSPQILIGRNWTDSTDTSDYPFSFRNAGFGAWSGGTSLTPGISHSIKIERLVTS